MNAKTIENFTLKIQADMAAYAVKHDPKTYILDPGKFGRVAAGKSDYAKNRVCRELNACIKCLGEITLLDVKVAFRQAGL